MDIKSSRNKRLNKLFNPYLNGICEYELAYLSSKALKKNNKFDLIKS